MNSFNISILQYGNVAIASRVAGVLKIMLFSALGAVLPIAAFAVTANNVFVTVSSSTAGVEGIFPVGGDFYVTTRGVTNPPFRADIGISANSPYYLVKPSSGRMNLTVGENEEYRVRDESGAEDSFTGCVYVVKIEIEPRETNVCWKTTSCKLKLTDDSVPGGVAVWTSSPGGISGSGNSITFNPSALSAGEYTVTARSGIVPSYFSTCIVRIVRIDTTTIAKVPTNRRRRKIGVGEKVYLSIYPRSAGPASWMVEGGGGNIIFSDNYSALFLAGSQDASSKVEALFSGGSCSAVFNVVAPSSFVVSKCEATGHGSYPLAVAMIADWFVGPDDVNFSSLRIGEKSCSAECSGYFSYQQGVLHLPGDELQVSEELEPGKGWKCIGSDVISGAATNLPYANGKFSWAIPVYYSLDEGANFEFKTVEQSKVLQINSAGTASLTIRKSQAVYTQQEIK